MSQGLVQKVSSQKTVHTSKPHLINYKTCFKLEKKQVNDVISGWALVPGVQESGCTEGERERKSRHCRKALHEAREREGFMFTLKHHPNWPYMSS